MLVARFAFLMALLSAGPTWAQSADGGAEGRKAREELCREVLCRPPTTVRVLLKGNQVLEVPFEDASPIVLPNGWVTVLPGEEVHIAFERDGELLRNPRALRQVADAKNTLSFRFSQNPKNGGSMLVVTSTVQQTVRFDLGMMLPDDDRVLKTSSCPVPAGRSAYEHWPQPIFQIVAARFRVLPPGSTMDCE